MRIPRTSVVAWVCLAVLLVVGLRFYLTPERALRNAAQDRRTLALQVLGQHIARQAPGGRVLVIGNPFAQQAGQSPDVYAFEEAAVSGLKKGLGDALEFTGTACPELDARAAANPGAVPLPPDLKTPLSLMTARGAWDRLQQEHPAATIWVSLIGLPAGITGTAVWRSEEIRCALLFPDLRVLGNRAAVRTAFRSGKLLGIVMNRPGAPPQNVAAEKSIQAEFDRRYLLVTPENFEEMLRTHPGLF